MILTASGQNIYPEEIEEMINSLPMVVESLVVSRKFALVALVVVDMDSAVSVGEKYLRAEVERQVFALNAMLPSYSKISICEIRTEPFEKTPKQPSRVTPTATPDNSSSLCESNISEGLETSLNPR